MSERKLAILIGSSEFPNSGGILKPLFAPCRDVAGVDSILSNPDRCWFHQIDKLCNKAHHEILVRINEVLRDANKEDLVLIYYSGHGKLDSESHLYLAAANTDPSLLRTTGIPIAAIHDCLANSRCARFVLILDCCYSGAAAHDLKNFSEGLGTGIGRFIMTASTAIQRSEEKERQDFSVFTKYLIDGLQSGDADRNNDGLISMEELFTFVREQMRRETLQEPMKWESGSAGNLVIAQTPRLRSTQLRQQARSRLERARENGELPAPLLQQAESLLAMQDHELRAEKNVTAALLIQWMRNDIATDDFVDQWYTLNSGLPAIDQPPEVRREERWWTVRRARQPLLDITIPAYLLDSSYHFLDWNPAFDEIIAKPLGLVRGRHAEDFILSLENKREVVERSQKEFSPGNVPLVDFELLKFRSQTYGLIQFGKIAAQIPSRDDRDLIWAVTLNIHSAEQHQTLWEAITTRLRKEINWSKYAISYDRMLLEFDAYKDLIKQIAAMVSGARICADLAAGTGNGTRALLEGNENGEVWAFESNEMMLERLRAKIKPPNSERVRVFKGDLTVSLQEFEEDFFDGAIMINALYAIEERQRCIREVFRVLKPGGLLVLSTSHRDTDVKKLFSAIRANFEAKGIWETMRPIVEDAYERHVNMDSDIHHDTRDAVIDYVRSAGFEIDQQIKSAYVGAVMIVSARKPAPRNPSPLLGKQARTRDQIFFSYSHTDRLWLQRFQKLLAPLQRNGNFKSWDDTQIRPGDEWREEIREALSSAKVAVLLVSADFLASPFISENELPPLLKAARTEGVKIIWVAVSDSLYGRTPIGNYQAAHNPSEPLDTLSPGVLNQALAAIAGKIAEAYETD